MGENAPFAPPKPTATHDRVARLAALLRLIDEAEREASALNAPECGLCLQLARVAVQNRQLSERGDG